MAAMPPKGTAESLSALEQAFAKYGKIVTLQDRFLIDQTRLKSERDTAIANFQVLKESISQFVQLSATDKAEATCSTTIKALEAAHDQVVADGARFDVQMALVIKQEQALGELEYEVGESLPNLLDGLAACFPSLKWKGKKSLSREPSWSRPPTSPALEPVETEYYEKRGDVRLLRDQLFNHLAELEVLREHESADTPASKQSHPLVQMTDQTEVQNQQSNTLARWKIEHEKLQDHIHSEETELKRLWDICQGAGIDVGQLSIELSSTPQVSARSPPLEPAHEQVKLDAPPFISVNSNGTVSRFFEGFPWPERGSLIPPALPNITDLAAKRDFIERWVVKLPDTLFGSRWTEFDHVVAESKQEPDWLDMHRDPRILRSSRSDEGLRSRHASTPDGECRM